MLHSPSLRPLLHLTVALLTALALVAGTAPAHAAKKSSTVKGFSTSTKTVEPGAKVKFKIKVVSGGRASKKRTVILQRRVNGRWAKVQAKRTNSKGRTVLGINVGSKVTTHKVRIKVKTTSKQRGVNTKAKKIRVRTTSYSATERTILSLVNDARSSSRKCGSKTYPAQRPVKLDKRLGAAAQGHARDMAVHDYFSHTGRDGSSVGDRVNRQGYRWSWVGENIAAGQHTTAEVMRGWLDSPGHCHNIMNGNFTELGVGLAKDSGSRYGTYWVQVFAQPR